MRIGYLTYGLDRNPTGIGRYALELLRALKLSNNAPEIVLLTTEKTDCYNLWNEFEHYALPGCHLLPGLLTLGNLALSQAVRRYNLQLVHDANGIAPFAGPSFGVRRIVTIHDTFAFVQPATHNRLDNWRYRWMLPNMLKKADMILTHSLNSSQDIQRFLAVPAAKIKVVPCAADAHFSVLPDIDAQKAAILTRYNIKSPYLFYVGSLNARKNIVGLLEAYALVKQQHPHITLVIGGKRQWKAAAIDTAMERLQLEGQVHFTGYIADEDLPLLYNAASIFVFPSLYEGFGLPPLEAMACGTPVITSNVSSLPEVMGDAGLLVDPYDTAGLAKAIERVLTDPILRHDLRQKGLQQAAKFTWQNTAAQTLALYQQVLN